MDDEDSGSESLAKMSRGSEGAPMSSIAGYGSSDEDDEDMDLELAYRSGTAGSMATSPMTDKSYLGLGASADLVATLSPIKDGGADVASRRLDSPPLPPLSAKFPPSEPDEDEFQQVLKPRQGRPILGKGLIKIQALTSNLK